MDAVPPRDLQPASITWRYTENPRDAVDQVRFKHLNSWVTKRKARLAVSTGEEHLNPFPRVQGLSCSARSDMFVVFGLKGKRVSRVLSLQSTSH